MTGQTHRLLQGPFAVRCPGRHERATCPVPLQRGRRWTEDSAVNNDEDPAWQRGAQRSSTSVPHAPDADDGQSDRLATDAAAAAEPGEPETSPAAGRDLDPERESLMRRQVSPGGSADLADKGQRPPDAARGGFGGGAAGGQAAAASSPPSRAMSRSTPDEPAVERETMPSKPAAAGPRTLGDLASDAASGEQDPQQAMKVGKAAAGSERPLREAEFESKPTQYFGQEGGAERGAGERAAKEQPQAGPAGLVAKPRLVRILFRVTPPASDAESKPMATPADPAESAPASQKEEKSPVNTPDKE